MSRHWWVVSPEWWEVEPVLDDGSGPLVPGRDVVCVEAATKREAVRLGVKAMNHWPREARCDGVNPFAGVTAEDALCPHGFCHCELPDCTIGHEANGHGDYCAECDAEFREAGRSGRL